MFLIKSSTYILPHIVSLKVSKKYYQSLHLGKKYKIIKNMTFITQTKYSMMKAILLNVIGLCGDRSMEMSNLSKNCANDVWYMLHTSDILQIRKYKTEPRVATGRNSSRAMFIFCSVSFAPSSFSLT